MSGTQCKCQLNCLRKWFMETLRKRHCSIDGIVSSSCCVIGRWTEGEFVYFPQNGKPYINLLKINCMTSNCVFIRKLMFSNNVILSFCCCCCFSPLFLFLSWLFAFTLFFSNKFLVYACVRAWDSFHLAIWLIACRVISDPKWKRLIEYEVMTILRESLPFNWNLNTMAMAIPKHISQSISLHKTSKDTLRRYKNHR